MKKAFAALTLLLAASCSTPVMADTYTDLAARLEASTTALYKGNSPGCTAWKSGPKTWQTAWHCVAQTGKEYSIKINGFKNSVRSITIPTEKNTIHGEWEDWATLRVAHEEDVPALEIDCTYIPKVGEEVAYSGRPFNGPKPLKVTSFGRLTSVITKDNVVKRRSVNYVASIDGGGGASGSPLVALKTGKVIGYITRAVPLSRGAVLGGIEGVGGMDRCEKAAESREAPEYKAIEGMYGSR